MTKILEEPRILVVDDHAIVRGGIKHLLKKAYPGATFVGCNCSSKALEAVRSTTFDLVFLDVSMPGKDGIEALREIRELKPNLPVIVLSIFREEAYATRAIQLGAASYLHKGVNQEVILEAAQAALTGQIFVSRESSNKASSQFGNRPGQNSIQDSIQTSIDCLSPKEHSIFIGLAQGTCLKELAAELGVSPKTVTTYRSRILSKLKLGSNADIVRYALKSGVIE